MSIASYNSDKVKLQNSIVDLYNTVNFNADNIIQYEAIKDETKRLFERQEVLFRMTGTLAVVAMIITVKRISM